MSCKLFRLNISDRLCFPYKDTNRLALVPIPSLGRYHLMILEFIDPQTPQVRIQKYFWRKNKMHHLQSLPIRASLEFEWQIWLGTQILLALASSFSSFHHPPLLLPLPSPFLHSLLPPTTLVVLLGFHVVVPILGKLSLDWCQIQGTNTLRRERPPPVSMRGSLRFAYLPVLLMSVSAEPGAVGDKLKFHLKQIWALINRLRPGSTWAIFATGMRSEHSWKRQ